ncbi:GNAT family N-acetyltransferase [Curvivirga sp.]|uniref:GNAT family N-acetyltransferase n=1 Tax=Curvivirga sp. TaxID=2856848 RepID=UPI003B596DDA
MTNRRLETERLILRPIEEADIDLALEMNTDPEVTKHLGGPLSVEENQKRMNKWLNLQKEGPHFGIWLMVRKEDNRKLGTIGMFKMPVDEEETTFTDYIEIGYRSIPEAWGKGYMTEGAKEVIRYIFTQTELEEIAGCADHENFASQTVLQKIGLEPKGTFYCYSDDLPFFLAQKDKWLAAYD